MKRLLAALIVIAAASFAPVVSAEVAEVTTSVSIANATSEAQLAEALKAAVEEVLRRPLPFDPTLVALTNARVVGDRLYLRLLLADEAGEAELADEIGVTTTDVDPKETI